MLLVRRLLLLWLLMFWLGGFTFYVAVVVPIGTDVLNSAVDQGWITRRVTFWMNAAGAVTLAGWAWDLAADPARTRLRQGARWALWLAMALLLAALVLLHPRMDALLDPDRERILDYHTFHILHRVYLWVSTVQWAAGILLSLATLHTWRDTDRARELSLRRLDGDAKSAANL